MIGRLCSALATDSFYLQVGAGYQTRCVAQIKGKTSCPGWGAQGVPSAWGVSWAAPQTCGVLLINGKRLCPGGVSWAAPQTCGIILWREQKVLGIQLMGCGAVNGKKSTCRVGRNHTCTVYGVLQYFWQGNHQYTVIYGVPVRYWSTLNMWCS